MRSKNKEKNVRLRTVAGLCCLLAVLLAVCAAFVVFCVFLPAYIPIGLPVFAAILLILSFFAYKLFNSGKWI